MATHDIVLALDSTDWLVRKKAVIELGELNATQGIVGMIVRMLSDPIEAVRVIAWGSVMDLACIEPSALSPYATSIVGKLRIDSFHAMLTLSCMEPVVVGAYLHEIASFLRDIGHDVDGWYTLERIYAIHTISKAQPASIRERYADTIAEFLDDESYQVRCAVCQFISDLEPIGRIKYVDAVASKIVDPSSYVRIEAMRMMEKLEPHAFAPYADAVAKRLGKGDNGERRASRDAMNRFAFNMCRMLDNTGRYSRASALAIFRQAGNGGKRAAQMNVGMETRIENAIQLERLTQTHDTYEYSRGRWMEVAAMRQFETELGQIG